MNCFQNRNRRLRAMSSVDYREPTGLQNKNTMLSDFHLIRRMLWCAGIVCLTSRDTKFRRMCAKLCHWVMNVIIIHLIASDVYTNTLLTFSTGYVFSTGGQRIMGLLLRIVFFQKMPAILRSVKRICASASCLFTERYQSINLYAVVCFFAAFILPVILIEPLTEDYNHDLIYEVEKDLFYQWNSQNSSIHLHHLVHTCVVLFFVVDSLVSCTLPLLLMVLIGYSLNILRKMNEQLLKTLCSKEHEFQGFLEEFLSWYTILEARVDDTKNAFSGVFFFLYSYIMACLFAYISYNLLFISDDPLWMAFQILYFVFIIGILTSLIGMAMRLSESSVAIRNKVYETVGGVTGTMEENWNSPKLTMVLLLADNFQANIVLSGLGFFQFNHRFVLTTAGAIVSYGIVIAQLA